DPAAVAVERRRRPGQRCTRVQRALTDVAGYFRTGGKLRSKGAFLMAFQAPSRPLRLALPPFLRLRPLWRAIRQGLSGPARSLGRRVLRCKSSPPSLGHVAWVVSLLRCRETATRGGRGRV